MGRFLGKLRKGNASDSANAPDVAVTFSEKAERWSERSDSSIGLGDGSGSTASVTDVEEHLLNMAALRVVRTPGCG